MASAHSGERPVRRMALAGVGAWGLNSKAFGSPRGGLARYDPAFG